MLGRDLTVTELSREMHLRLGFRRSDVIDTPTANRFDFRKN